MPWYCHRTYPKQLIPYNMYHERKPTFTLSMWFCKSSMSRSPTGFQEFFTVSACRSLKSSWSWASWSSISLIMASSSCCCQSTAAAPRFFHRTVTSSTSLRNMRPTFWTLSSGLTSGPHTINRIQVIASGISCIGHMCKISYPFVQASVPDPHEASRRGRF